MATTSRHNPGHQHCLGRELRSAVSVRRRSNSWSRTLMPCRCSVRQQSCTQRKSICRPAEHPAWIWRRRVSRTILTGTAGTRSLRCPCSSQSSSQSTWHSSITAACASPGSCHLRINSRTQHSSSTNLKPSNHTRTSSSRNRSSRHHVFRTASSRWPSTPWRAWMAALREAHHDGVRAGHVECGVEEHLPWHGLQRLNMGSGRKSRRSSECAQQGRARETGLEQWTAEMWVSRRLQSNGHGKSMLRKRHYMCPEWMRFGAGQYVLSAPVHYGVCASARKPWFRARACQESLAHGVEAPPPL